MKYLYIVFILTFIGLITMSNKGGRAGSQGIGSTGAPKENTVCKSCHNGPIDVSLKLQVFFNGDTVASYKPGEKYLVKVTVNHIGGNTPKGYGFQMLVLNASLGIDGPDLKNLSPATKNVKISTALNNRLYAEHNNRSDVNIFEINWTAPTAGSGPVSFYAAGNGVNADNDLSGDGSAKVNLQLNEEVSSSTKYLNAGNSISFYPNPAYDLVNIKDETGKVSQVIVRDLLGKSLKKIPLEFGKKCFNVADLVDGVYLLQFQANDGETLKTQRLFKKSLRP
ncbi:MAG: T9SS type A sorting domain-containing protein [Saprospiraceae bacterium]|nr:T9SS type A sorting domain-containing protein [Candidatus Vicinibacter proximus]